MAEAPEGHTSSCSLQEPCKDHLVKALRELHRGFPKLGQPFWGSWGPHYKAHSILVSIWGKLPFLVVFMFL